MSPVKDLGETTNIEVIDQFVTLKDQLVIDAGCGSMGVTRLLSELGARVLAIDPDPIQAEQNRAAAPLANVEFVEIGADTLPAPDHSVDGVFFSYSLHHIPQSIYPQVFAEVLRVLKPNGFLYVIEPIACPLNEVMMLFHNEERERADAQRALEELAIPAFRSAQVVTYHGYSQYDSFEDFAQHYSNRSFSPHYTGADVRRPEVRAVFERLGAPDYRFQSPKQVMYLHGLKDSLSD